MKKRPTVHLASLGCAKNLVDSERILARLAAAGAVVGAAAEAADIIIVNTCGFIDSAKEESIDTIIELGRLRASGPCRKLIVMGCLAQRYADDLRAALPEVDAIFGLGEEAAIVAACGLGRSHEAGRLLLTPAHTAYLRIADGCDNRCAYCAIPLIRGPFRSRPAKDILAEARQLVDRGARELNVIAQDTSMYGADRPRGPRIHDLLAELAAIPRLRWLRLLYTHPAHFSDALIDAYAALDKLCPYVDLPLQHLDDVILRRMGRKVTQAQILDLIARLRARVPGVAIRTAFIVGFPGETRAQFRTMLDLVREIGFDHLGAFTWSPEEGTRAARMRGRVNDATKHRRLGELMRAQQQIIAAKHAALIGATCEVVIERPTPDGRSQARTRAQAPDVDGITRVTGEGLRPGDFMRVRITGAEGYDLLAETAERQG